MLYIVYLKEGNEQGSPDLNREPADLESAALPLELLP